MAGFLTGVRIITFTTGVAGPYAARLLAQSGAEVIKIESRHGGLDSFRYFSEKDDIDTSPRYIEGNLNVLSAQLNLKKPEGVRLLRELAAKSDVVLDNFRADVLPRFGLGPDDLHAVRQDLIVIKMPGLGTTGPKGWYGTWGSSLTAFSGMSYLWNHPNQPRPVGYQGVYPDYLSSVFAPTVVLAALLHRRKTGTGIYIDLAQVEVAAHMLGVNLLDAAVNAREPQPVGNDGPGAAPHGCYPCAGNDCWCVIAVETDEQWQALCDVMEREDLARDPRFATLAGRRANRAALDEAVARWTRSHGPHDVMHACQARGVPAGAVQSGEDLFHDPHLRARGFIAAVDQPRVGSVPLADVPLHLAGGLDEPRSAATLGEHNAYVFCDVLGYSPDQLRAWQEGGVVE